MRGRGALLLALCCLGAGLAAAQDGFCAGAMPAGTAEPGFWEQLPEVRPHAARNMHAFLPACRR